LLLAFRNIGFYIPAMQNFWHTWLHGLILCGYLAGLLHPFSPWWEYVLNKQFIARVLCENRDQPQKHCEGKCYLGKRLGQVSQESDRQQTALPQKNDSEKQMLYLCNDDKTFLLSIEIAEWLRHEKGRFAPSTLSDEVFHPPRPRLAF